jgi:ABC-type transport system substrate-binding protein
MRTQFTEGGEMMKKTVSVLLTCVLLLGLLAGCGGTPAGGKGPGNANAEPVKGGTLIAVLPNDPALLNPCLAQDEAAGILIYQLFNNLVMMDVDYNIIPDLADSWEYNDDYTELAFHLHESVKWHDGEEFTAEDVVFTMNTIQEQAGTLSMSLMNVTSVEAVDKHTVVFKSAVPDTTLLYNLAWFGGSIIPKHIYEGTDWTTNPANQAPIGTGPFKFVSAQTGVSIELAANEDYFRDGPYLDKIVFQIIPDAETEYQMWKNGEVDLMYSAIPGADFTLYDNDPNYASRFNLLCNRNYFTFNFAKEDNPFLDVRLRKALNLALNRQQILDVGLKGNGALAEYYISPMYDWALNENAKIPERNVEEAKRLLEEAGYTPDANGYYLTFSVVVFDFADVLTVAQANLKEAGINMQIEMIEMNAWIDKVLISGNYDVTFLGGDQGPDISSIGNRIGTFGPVNAGRYSNDTVNDLLAQGTQTDDQAERARIYKEIQQIMADELPMVITNEMGLKYAVSSRIHGVPMIDDAARGKVGKMSYALVWMEP